MASKLHLRLPDIRQMDIRRLPSSIKNWATEGWYVKGDGPSKDRLHLLGYNYTANVIANLIGGSFYTGLLLLINASDSFIGSMTMISTAANMLQVFAPIFLERFEKRKKLLIILRSVILFFNIIMIGLIPIFPVGQQTQLALFALSILIINLINAFISPGFTVWHIKSIPPNVRNSFFSLTTMTVGAVVALCNLGGSAIVDACKAGGNEYLGLAIVRGIALLIAVVDIWLLTHITEYPNEPGEKLNVVELIAKPIKNKLYLRTVAVTFLWNISANIPGSYYTVYLLKDLGMNYSFITLCSMLNIPVVMLFTPIWSRIVRKLGWIRTLYTAMSLYLLHYALLSCITKNNFWLYPVTLFYAYITAVGINLPFSAIPYINIPQQNQTVFIGFYSTAANLAALLGVTIGKYFILGTEGKTFHLLGLVMTNKQSIPLLTAACMVVAVIGIFFVRKSLPKDGDY